MRSRHALTFLAVAGFSGALAPEIEAGGRPTRATASWRKGGRGLASARSGTAPARTPVEVAEHAEWSAHEASREAAEARQLAIRARATERSARLAADVATRRAASLRARATLERRRVNARPRPDDAPLAARRTDTWAVVEVMRDEMRRHDRPLGRLRSWLAHLFGRPSARDAVAARLDEAESAWAGAVKDQLDAHDLYRSTTIEATLAEARAFEAAQEQRRAEGALTLARRGARDAARRAARAESVAGRVTRAASLARVAADGAR